MTRPLLPAALAFLALLAGSVLSACAAEDSPPPAASPIPSPSASDAPGSGGFSSPVPPATPPAPPARPAAVASDRPAASSSPSAAPAVPGGLFPVPPDRDLFQLVAELRLGADPDSIPRTAAGGPVEKVPGQRETLWLVDLGADRAYQSAFTLQLVTDHAYWYVEDGLSVAPGHLAEAARRFEEDVYPSVTAAFGREWIPGVDGDPRLAVINGDIRGAGGYYSSLDEYPVEISSRSNQREAIYINVKAVPVTSKIYLDILAHELQHAIHWHADESEETWVDEGLAELAVTTFRRGQPGIRIGSPAPTVSLVNWTIHSGLSRHNYWASSLFFHYLEQHYARDGDMRPLLSEPADGIAGIDSYLSGQGSDRTFNDVFADWAVALYLDAPEGIYSIGEFAVGGRPTGSIRGFSSRESDIPQYSAHHIELEDLSGPAHIHFSGPVATPLIPADVGEEGCWWGNLGDSIASSLARRVDLRDVAEAQLRYQVWSEIEKSWDYAYLQVSTDDGATWNVIEAPHSYPPSDLGVIFGPGYSGDLDWTSETVDLSPYAGQEISLRFQYITDDAIHGTGICLRNLVVTAGGQPLPGTWQPDGFVFTNNRVPQQFVVQVIQQADAAQVDRMVLDAANTGEFTVPSPEALDRLVVVVAPLGFPTRQPASYTLSVEPAR